jgi:hypothetical protein
MALPGSFHDKFNQLLQGSGLHWLAPGDESDSVVVNSSLSQLLPNSYSNDPLSLVIFGIHLGLLGYLIYGSGYFTRIIGILLAIDGLGGVIDSLRPYPYPNAHLGFIFIAFFGELIFMLWLLVRGWKIQEPTEHLEPTHFAAVERLAAADRRLAATIDHPLRTSYFWFNRRATDLRWSRVAP